VPKQLVVSLKEKLNREGLLVESRHLPTGIKFFVHKNLIATSRLLVLSSLRYC